MTSFIIPFLVVFIVMYGFINNVSIYDKFLEGVLQGLELSLKIFPNIFAMSLGVNVLIKSNVINDFVMLIKPFLDNIGYPKELVLLGIMRPISGSSSFKSVIFATSILLIDG